MEKTRDLGSALVAAAGGVLTAIAFVALFAACLLPIERVLEQLM